MIMNEILSVDRFYIEYVPGNKTVSVTVIATVDNMILLHHQTQNEPEEWGPTLCESTMTFEDWEDDVLLSEKDLIKLFEGCTWKIYEGDT